MPIVKHTLDPKNPPKMGADDRVKFDAISDDDIDYSDIPELSDDFLMNMGSLIRGQPNRRAS